MYISWILIIVAAIIALCEFCKNFKRGLRRALIRFITFAACAVGAYFLRNIVTALLYEIPKFKEHIDTIAGDNSYSLYLSPIVKMIVTLVVFAIIYIILCPISLCVYNAINNLTMPENEKEYKKFGGPVPKRRFKLLGSVFGLASAAITIACVILPMHKTFKTVEELSTLKQEIGITQEFKGIRFVSGYSDSNMAKYIDKADYTNDYITTMNITVNEEDKPSVSGKEKKTNLTELMDSLKKELDK